MMLGNNSYKTAQAVYPSQPVEVQDGKINALQIANNNFIAVMLEK